MIYSFRKSRGDAHIRPDDPKVARVLEIVAEAQATGNPQVLRDLSLHKIAEMMKVEKSDLSIRFEAVKNEKLHLYLRRLANSMQNKDSAPENGLG